MSARHLLLVLTPAGVLLLGTCHLRCSCSHCHVHLCCVGFQVSDQPTFQIFAHCTACPERGKGQIRADPGWGCSAAAQYITGPLLLCHCGRHSLVHLVWLLQCHTHAVPHHAAQLSVHDGCWIARCLRVCVRPGVNAAAVLLINADDILRQACWLPVDDHGPCCI